MSDLPLLDALLRRRYWVLISLSTFMFVGGAVNLTADNDWQFFTWGSDVLFGAHYPFVRSTDHIEAGAAGGLHLYANYPFLQIGPPALLLAKLLQFGPREGLFVAGALVQALALLIIFAIDRAFAPSTRRTGLNILIGGGVMTVVWASLVHVTHLDDALALTALSGAVCAVVRNRCVPAGLMLGLAAASKPWAVVLIPLVLAFGSWRSRALAAGMAATVIAVFWGPFVLADFGTLDVGRVDLVVLPSSAPGAFGAHIVAHPSVLRLGELLAGGAVGAALVLRTRNWPLVPLAALTTRLLLEPGAYAYYAAAPVAAALLVDVAVVRARVPILTGVVAAAWLGVGLSATDAVAAWIRLITYVGLLSAAWLLASLRPYGISAGEPHLRPV